MKKRIISILLVTIMLCTMLPQVALFASAEEYSGTCGADLRWSLDTDTGVLTITGTGEMNDENWGFADYVPWAYYRKHITSVLIDSGVTYIGTNAFAQCVNMTSVTISNSVTRIGKSVFSGCSSLTSITLPDGVTGIGYSAFKNCSGLISITIPSGVTSIEGSLFSGCKNLTSITIPDGITSIGSSAFSGCGALTSITIPDGVTNIDTYTFENCASLTNIRIPNGVTAIGNRAFQKCTGLTSIIIPSSVASIGDYAFYGCSQLENITIPTGVTSISGYTFNGCAGLASIEIPVSVTKISLNAFAGCSGLKDVYYGGDADAWGKIVFHSGNECLTDAVIHFEEDAFPISGTCGPSLGWELDRFGNLTISGTGEMDQWYSGGGEAGGTPWGDYCGMITSVTVSDGVTNIGDYAFARCKNLKNISIGKDITTIGVSAFEDCAELESISIPEEVQIIGRNAFKGCTGLTKFTIPNLVCNIDDSVFAGCSGLASILIPDRVKQIGASAFSGCTGLESVVIPADMEKISDSAFSGCSALTDVYYGGDENTWSSINIGNDNDALINATIHYNFKVGICGPDLTWMLDTATGALTITGTGRMTGWLNQEDNVPWTAYRDMITSVSIGKGVKDIGDNAFYKCTGMTSVTIPDSVKDIGTSAFKGCTKLTSILIPDGVTRIYSAVFRDCTSLTSIVVPDAVNTIDSFALYNCPNLTDVYYSGDEGGWSSITIKEFNDNLTNARVHYSVSDPTNHITVSYVQPTCVADGSYNYSCPCGYSWSEKGATAIGHSWVLTKTVAPTCGADGYDFETCSVCGETRQTNIVTDRPEHTYIDEIVAADCENGGYTKHTCSFCGETYTSDATPALGHDYVDGECSRCGEEDPDYNSKPTDCGGDQTVCPSVVFMDAPDYGEWSHQGIDFCINRGLFGGTSTTSFEPETQMNRAMLVTVLWRYEGSPKNHKNAFIDVAQGEWYTEAVAWAAATGVVNGVGEGKFDPEGIITREQMATILFRYSEFKQISTDNRADFSAFPDATKVSAYAKTAMQWAVAEGLIGGSKEGGATYILPLDGATRAQVATILMRYIQNLVEK